MSETLSAEDIEAAFTKAAPVRGRGLCPAGRLLAEHPALEPKVMDVESYSSAFVAKVLKGLGFNISDHTISHHRQGACRCPKKETP